eukprot:TRINITY_DN2328_c0_g1_i1.p1 TRINITY_DN2328_c0_g1~~TRINITY_DN2328_c0_g1_i1.p1  ORF type:complete len:60 (+),score=17.28 TRINITY_DN2328_c0_g1_i1:227-406(+)
MASFTKAKILKKTKLGYEVNWYEYGSTETQDLPLEKIQKVEKLDEKLDEDDNEKMMKVT